MKASRGLGSCASFLLMCVYEFLFLGDLSSLNTRALRLRYFLRSDALRTLYPGVCVFSSLHRRILCWVSDGVSLCNPGEAEMFLFAGSTGDRVRSFLIFPGPALFRYFCRFTPCVFSWAVSLLLWLFLTDFSHRGTGFIRHGPLWGDGSWLPGLW